MLQSSLYADGEQISNKVNRLSDNSAASIEYSNFEYIFSANL